MSDIKDNKIFVFSFSCDSLRIEGTCWCKQADRGTLIVDFGWEEGQFGKESKRN